MSEEKLNLIKGNRNDAGGDSGGSSSNNNNFPPLQLPIAIPEETSSPSTLTVALGEAGSLIGIYIAKMLME